MLTIDHLNSVEVDTFINTLSGIYEHSPWVAEAVATQRPFTSRESLLASMQSVVNESSEEVRLNLLKAHPEFAGKAATRGELTEASTREQGSLSLQRLPPDQHRHMQDLNAQYMEKFGFPGIVAVRKQNSVEGIFALLEKRLQNDFASEVKDAIEQVHLIAECRLIDLVE